MFSDDRMELPIEIRDILSKIDEAGYRSYVVGGCVRDYILGRDISDYDITTSATPEEVTEIFGEGNTIKTGIAHGTVTVLYSGQKVEITTHRVEEGYSDGRRPDAVIYSDNINDDLSRRDFTINAIAYSPKAGFIDPFGGVSDLENRLIRTVGRAKDRFIEDGLRIMRCIRFASTLGFKIDEETKKAVLAEKDRLNNISEERIQVELLKLITGENFEKVLRDYVSVVAVKIPELTAMIGFLQHTPYHIYDVWEHTLKAMAGVPSDEILRLTMLLHDIGKPQTFSTDVNGIGHFYGHPKRSSEMAIVILERLKFPTKTINLIAELVEFHYIELLPTEKAMKKLLNKLGEDELRLLLKVRCGDDGAKSEFFKDKFVDVNVLNEVIDKIIADKQCFTLASLNISGRDIMGLGIKPSPMISEVLGKLLEEVIDGVLENQQYVLIKRAIEIIKAHK